MLTVSPAPGLAEVPVATQVVATFSRALRCATVTSASFVLSTGDGTVDATVDCDGDSATLTPAEPLPVGKPFVAVLTPEIEDERGGALAAIYSWSFSTAGGQAPAGAPAPLEVISYWPGPGQTGVSPGAVLRVELSGTVDPASVEPITLRLTSPRGPVRATVSSAGATLLLVPTAPLEASTSYTAVLGTGVRDLAGDGLTSGLEWTFTTSGPWPGTRQIGSVGSDIARGVAVDGRGNVVVVGSTTGSLDGLASGGGNDMFALELDASGNRVWTTLLGTGQSENAFAVALAADGSVVVGGETDGPDDTGPFAVVIELDAAGEEVWRWQLGAPAIGSIGGVAVDPYGNVLVAGFTFDPADGNADAFLIELDAGGALVWERRFVTAGNDWGYAVAADADGNIFLAGSTTGWVDGGPSLGGSDLFLVKYDAAGEELWSVRGGTSGNDLVAGIAVDAAGNAIVVGRSNGLFLTGGLNGNYDAFVAKYDGSGNELWTRQLGTTAFEGATGVAVTAGGGVVVSGYTTGAFGASRAEGASDAFVLALDEWGATSWITQTGTRFDDVAAGVAVAASGDVFVAGYTGGSLAGNATAGQEDVFVAKYDALGREQPFTPYGPDVTPPEVASFVPGPGQSGVTVGALVTVSFTEPVCPEPVTATSLRLFSPLGDIVPGTVYCQGAELTFTPAGPLEFSTSYTAIAGAGIADLAGNLLARPTEWTFTTAPPWRGALQIASPMMDGTSGLAIDRRGSLLVAGTTAGALAGQTGAGGSDAFLAKYDASGRALWTRQLGTTADDTAVGVAIDAADDALVAFSTYGPNGYAASVAKLDPSGARLWLRDGVFGWTGTSTLATGIAVDPEGNVVIVGCVLPPPPGFADAVVTTLDGAGKTLWTRQFGSSDSDCARAVAVDGYGSIFIAGDTGGTLAGQSSQGSRDIFLVKYGSAGALLWTRQTGTADWDGAAGVAVDANGAAYVSGYSGMVATVVMKYDASGSREWITQDLGTAVNAPQQIAVDTEGSAFVVGVTEGSFDGAPSAGGYDFFTVKYDRTGAKLWSRQIGSTGDDGASAVAVDAKGSVFVGGATDAAFYGHASGGSGDVMILKYDAFGNLQ